MSERTSTSTGADDDTAITPAVTDADAAPNRADRLMGRDGDQASPQNRGSNGSRSASGSRSARGSKPTAPAGSGNGSTAAGHLSAPQQSGSAGSAASPTVAAPTPAAPTPAAPTSAAPVPAAAPSSAPTAETTRPVERPSTFAPATPTAVPATRTEAKVATATGAGAVATAKAQTPAVRTGKPRRARLRLSRIDPWSVMKTSFLFSIAFGIASWVAVAFFWWVIVQSGLIASINDMAAKVLSSPGDANPFRLEQYVNGSRVLGGWALLMVVDVILITAIATVGSFLYNLSSTMLGGLQVTLAETDD